MTAATVSADSSIPGAKRILVVLSLINLFNYLDRYVLSAVLEPIKTELQITDDGDMGRLATAFMLGYFLTSPIFGYLGDRLPRKYLMALGVIGWSLGTCLTGYAQAFAFMVFCRVLVGLGEASFGAIGPAVISDAYSKEKRNGAMTIFYLAVPLGAAFGFVLGGMIAAKMGWRHAFYWTGLPGFLLAALLLIVPEPKRGQSDAADAAEGSKKVSLADIKSFAYNKQYLLAVAGYVFYTFAMGAFSFWGPTFLTRVHHLDTEKASGFFGPTLVVGGVFGTLLGGRLATAWQKKSPAGYARLLYLSVALAIPFSFFAFLTSDATTAMVSMAIALIFLFLSTGPINTVLVEAVPVNTRASAMAISIFLIHALGDLWSPELVGRTADAFENLRYGMLILPSAFILATLFWAWLARVQGGKKA
ncbi:MFS transporter [bacterium]|nr:MFS transporter [bacterium]